MKCVDAHTEGEETDRHGDDRGARIAEQLCYGHTRQPVHPDIFGFFVSDHE
jgi:hypothetical protein